MLDLHRFAVFALLLERGDECTAFDLFCGSELSELVKNSRVAKLKLLSDLLQVELRILAFLFLLSILTKDSIHFC